MTIKYLLKDEEDGYLVDDEWDGKSYTKTPVFTEHFSFDTKQEAASYAKRFRLKVVAVQETITTHPSHSYYKKIFTPKGKYILRCSRCHLGTKARRSFDTVLKEYKELTQQVSCSIYTYQEVKVTDNRCTNV